jgi:exodeoxyribonuclease VII large subunit
VGEELTKISQLRDRTLRHIKNSIDFEIHRLENIRTRPIFKDPMTIVTTRSDDLSALRARSLRSTESRVLLASEELANLRTQVRTLSPQATLDRGYAVVLTGAGAVVRDAKNLHVGEKIAIRVARGVVAATTDGVVPEQEE